MNGDSKNEKSLANWLLLFAAVIYPLFVVGFELFTGMCAETFFDPMPSVFHTLLILLVPAANFLIWWKLRYGTPLNTRFLLMLSAIAIAVAAYYFVVFLPLLPISVIAIMFMGIGLLPFAPLVSLVCAIRLYKRLKKNDDSENARRPYLLKGMLAGLFALIILDLPSGATYLGVNWALDDEKDVQTRGIKLLRALGDRDLLLRLSYDGNRRATGVLGFAALMQRDSGHVPAGKAREIFYRVTGDSFNAHPVPYSGRAWSRFDDFRFDADQGGAEVGGRVKGLELISSSLDGSVSADDGVAYMEWVLEFRNTSFVQREARVQIAIPPDGVVSRASLWVNGEEREAAFAGRAKVRQAYERVVRARRDPLLVTTAGVDNVLAQAFPIAPNGGTIKFKLGITAPMTLKGLDKASLVLPAIVDRNFSFSDQFTHAVWFESEQPIETTLEGISENKVSAELYRLSGSVSDKALSGIRQVIASTKNASIKTRTASYIEGEIVQQEIVSFNHHFKGALFVVIDGSAKVSDFENEISASLDAIPMGMKVGVIVASDKNQIVDIAEWSQEQKEHILAILQEQKFVGGQDNALALADAIKKLEQYEAAELLWIHAPQAILFDGTSSLITQAAKRLIRMPRITSYSLLPGPSKLLSNPLIELNSRIIPNRGNVESDLKDYFQSLYSMKTQHGFRRSITKASNASVNGSEHIARLWARDKIASLIKDDDKASAIELAGNYQLVTSVSGAVVLENKEQYEQNDLTPVSKNTVPTIPEPRQWILAFIVLAFLLWFLKRNKFTLIKPV